MGGQGSGAKPRDTETKRIALALLSRGVVSPAELTEFVTFDRSIFYRWARSANIDCQRIRRQVVTRLWYKEARRGTKLGQAKAPRPRQRRSARRD